MLSMLASSSSGFDVAIFSEMPGYMSLGDWTSLHFTTNTTSPSEQLTERIYI